MTITIGTGALIGNGITIDGGVTVAGLPTPGGTNWYFYEDVAYGNGRFVAVTRIGQLVGSPLASTVGIYSAQGTGWTSMTMPSAEWSTVAYGDNKFVATSSGTAAAYSSDGISWTSSTLPASQLWQTLAYGAGLWVTCGNSSTYATSTDAITWTSRTLPGGGSYNISAMTYANGYFVALDQNGSSLRSSDGITWTTSGVSNKPLPDCFGITYGDGRYVAVSQNTGTFETCDSTDGLVWTQRTGASVNVYWTDVVYGNNQFVAVGWDNTASKAEVMTSTNGINWTLGSLAVSGIWNNIAFGPGMYEGYVIVGYADGGAGPGQVSVSRDGVTWF